MKTTDDPLKSIRGMSSLELGEMYDQDQISDYDYLLGVIFGISDSKLLAEYRKLLLRAPSDSTHMIEDRVHRMTLRLLLSEMVRRDLGWPLKRIP